MDALSVEVAFVETAISALEVAIETVASQALRTSSLPAVQSNLWKQVNEYRATKEILLQKLQGMKSNRSLR